MRFDELGKGQMRQALGKRIYFKWEAIGHNLISSVFCFCFCFFKQICCVEHVCCEVRVKMEGYQEDVG